MSRGLKWASLMAVASAVAAAVVGVVVLTFVLGNPFGSFDVVLVPPAALAAGALGGALWWALVERPCRLTDGRAITTGSLVGLLAHPLMWGLYILGGPLFLPGGWSEPSVMVEFTLMFAVLSVLFTGGLTVLAGALCGLLVVRLRRSLSTA